MANDVELSVGADVGQAKASVDDLRKVFTEFFSSFGLGKEQVAEWSNAFAEEFAKAGSSVEDAKAHIEELRPAFEDAKRAADAAAGEGNAGGGGIGGFSFSLKDMAKSAGAGISILSILRENYDALKPSLEALRKLTIDYAEALGIERDKTDALIDRISALVDPRKIVAAITKDAQRASREIAAALVDESTVVANLSDEERKLAQAKAEAMRAGQDREAGIEKEREANAALAEVLANAAAAELASGEVSKRTLNDIEKLNQAYADAGDEIPPKFAAIVEQLGILTQEQERAAEESERAAEKSSKAAEKRAEAEEAAATREIAASKSRQEAAAEAAQAAVAAADEEIAASQKRLDAALAKGAPIDNSGVPTGDGTGPEKGSKAAELAKVKQQIADIEGQDLISPEKFNQADALKARARELTQELRGLNAAGSETSQVFTVTADNFLTEAEAAEAASAAMDVHTALLTKAKVEQDALVESQEKNEVTASKLADANERLSRLVGDAGGGFTDLDESASGAAESVDQAAGAVDGLVDSAGAVQGAASDAAGAMGELADATAEVGKGDGSGGPLEGLQGGLEKSKTGAEDAAQATKDWIADLSTAEQIIDRIATKLANLQLGAAG